MKPWSNERKTKLANELESFFKSEVGSLKRIEAHRIGAALRLVVRSAGEPARKLRSIYKTLDTNKGQ